jgi:predicted ATPase
MISRIRIQNFRSLIDVDVNLEPLTVLIGRSGTGKSNFVGAIRALRDMVSHQAVGNDNQPLGRQPAPHKFEVELSASTRSPGYSYRLAFGASNPIMESLSVRDRVIFSQGLREWNVAPNVTPAPDPGQVVLGSLTGLRDAAVAFNLISRGIGCYDFPGNVLQQKGEQAVAGGFSDRGRNPLTVVSSLHDDINRLNDWSALTDTMSSLNPSVRSIDLKLPERNELQVGYQVGDKIMLMGVAAESEGFRRYLATLLALYQTPAKQTLIFEHPENGIHPGAMETLANEFKRHVRQGRGQVIITTHSPQLLDHFEPEQIRVVDIENQQTHIGPLASEQMEALRERLLKPGELLTVDPARLDGQLAEVPA